MTSTETSIPSREETLFAAALRTFGFMKATKEVPSMWAQAIALPEGAGYLVPVCQIHANDLVFLSTLSEWSRAVGKGYPSTFPMSPEEAQQWVVHHILDVPESILFVISDAKGNPKGHIGLTADRKTLGSLEISQLFSISPKLSTQALTTLVRWAEDTMGITRFTIEHLACHTEDIDRSAKCDFVNGPSDQEDTVKMEYRPQSVCGGEQMILTAGPSIGPRETSYVLDAARTGWNGKWNGYLKAFEETFANYMGRKYALATSSCTGALHLSLLALGIGPGDEVIVPDLTWVATANAVKYTGATPVFADIEADTWTVDAMSIRKLITRKTKAIIPVHLYGHPARMEPIVALAKEFGVFIVEDAAPAIGALAHGLKAGTFGDFACFSFQGAKLLVTGEGGMLVTDDEALYQRVSRLADQGRDPKIMFWISDEGWKYKMSNVQAALGLGQLERVDELVEMKRQIFSWYAEELEGIEGLTLQHEADYARSIYWMTNIELAEGIDREPFRKILKDRNIDTRPVFPTISRYPIWKQRQDPQPTAARVGAQAINLPSGGTLRREQIAYVGQTIREVMAETLRNRNAA